MKYYFKKGDKLRVIDNKGFEEHFKEGDIVTCLKEVDTDYRMKLMEINSGEHDHRCLVSRFELVKAGRPKKIKQPDKHLVLIDSCQNFVGIENSYKEAVKLAQSQTEDATIYKLKEIANVSSVRKVSKVKVKKKVKK